MIKKLSVLLFAVLFFSCETTITPELETAERIIVVDAWVNQKMERQHIRVNRSQPYFENSAPENLKDVKVLIEDLDSNVTYEFEEGETSYYWDPIDSPFGVVGHQYRLTISIEGETFEAYSTLGRVPSIDSIEFSYNTEDILIPQPYYTAEFKAVEPEGVGDTYWIKTWKNGHYLNKPGELNMAYDASFTSGQSVDGQQFIIPIRRDFISPLDENPNKKNEFLSPYVIGDSVYVEIHSVDPAAYEFLFGLYFQITRPGGFAELFSTPLANVTTNLKSTDEKSSTKISGFFNTAAVSAASGLLTNEIAEQAKKNSE